MLYQVAGNTLDAYSSTEIRDHSGLLDICRRLSNESRVCLFSPHKPQ